MRHTMGRHNGIDYILQRVCDMTVNPSTARMYYTYVGGKPTGDSFKTLADMKQWIDNRS